MVETIKNYSKTNWALNIQGFFSSGKRRRVV